MRPRFAKAGVYALAFCALIIFYSSTSPGNLSESNDAYWYSDIVENARITEMEDSRSPLFFITSKVVFLAARRIHQGVSGFDVLWWMNAVCASAGVLLLYRFLRAPCNCGAPAALFGAGVLGLSYGFWRYSTVPELYAPSIFLTLLALLAVASTESTAADGRGLRERLAMMPFLGALSGLAVLFYRPVCIVLFIVYPLSVLRMSRIPALAVYGASGGLIVLIGYVALFGMTQTETISAENVVGFVFSRSAEFTGNDFAPSTILGGIAAFLRMIVAGQWVLGFDAVREWLAAAIPDKEAPNELYQAARSGVLPYVSLLILAPLLAAFGSLCVIAFRNRQRARSGHATALFAWWCLIYFAFCFYLAPFAYEVYIMILPAVAGLAAIWLGEPAAATGRTWLLGLALALFGAFNWVGGLAVVNGAESDYVKRRSAWLASHARSGDLVVVAPRNSWETMTYLRYVTDSEVVMVDHPDVSAAIESTFAGGGRVFTFDDVLRGPPSSVSPGRPAGTVRDVVEGLRPISRIVHENDAGKTFQIAPRNEAP